MFWHHEPTPQPSKQHGTSGTHGRPGSTHAGRVSSGVVALDVGALVVVELGAELVLLLLVTAVAVLVPVELNGPEVEAPPELVSASLEK